MTNSPLKKAIIYCRVSSDRQKSEGHGLESQEHRCVQFAKERGYVVEKTFADSYSGGGDFMRRPAMKEVLCFLDDHPIESYVIIFDDLKRFARDTIFHWNLRSALQARNAKPLCLNYNFDESPEGVFVETIFAAQNQLEREQNRRQVIQKMKARLEKGYWPFNAPIGYIWKKDSIHGKILIQSKEGQVIKEALEGFAYGRFETQRAVQAFLEEKAIRNGKYIYLTFIRDILERILYAGYVEFPAWNISRRRGVHEPLISLETYNKIQSKLHGSSKRPNTKNIREDFPLRGFVHCSLCRKPYTANWSTGRLKKYPFYRCHHKECQLFGKSIRRDDIDKKFENILKTIMPVCGLTPYAKERFQTRWTAKTEQMKTKITIVEKEVIAVEKQINDLANRVPQVHSSVATIYERNIQKLVNQKIELEDKLKQSNAIHSENVETAFDAFTQFIKNPYDTWVKGTLSIRKLLLKILFETPLVYDKFLGFETAKLRYNVKVFKQFVSPYSADVDAISNSENSPIPEKDIDWDLFEKEIIQSALLIKSAQSP
ncbi:MAG: resolvase [Bacteroidetes bacterium]|nr:MAG: resolvase [Bacteroidota bacterium]REK06573.1 MAG: resolvase [Bacteroidota bacterium]REK33339.1 MAG: resolvase [Bacteroidota bacterium]REK49739.1 MAG: resolvase [Bacteroidota bacterium]